MPGGRAARFLSRWGPHQPSMPGSPLNYYQAQTSERKLRGQYYTPDELVGMMLEVLELTPRHRVIDPACGDGGFLRGVVACIARRFGGGDVAALARYWADRLIGFDVDREAVAVARCRLRE